MREKCPFNLNNGQRPASYFGRKKHELRASIVQVYIILYVQVRAPVADFCGSLHGRNFQQRQIIRVVNGDALLVIRDEVLVRRSWNVVERPISDGRARLCDGCFESESIDILGFSV